LRRACGVILVVTAISLLANLAQFQTERYRQNQRNVLRTDAAATVVGRLKAAIEALQRFDGSWPQGVPELLLAVQALQTADDSLMVLRTETKANLVNSYLRLSDSVGVAHADITEAIVRGNLTRLPTVRLRLQNIYQQFPTNMGEGYISPFEAALARLQWPG